MEPSGVITILSDFGLADGYTAAMKGVILGLAPAAVLVDVTHLVARHDVIGGAYVLATSAPYFPRGTVHLVVVDPGVGSSRAAVAVRTPSAWFVGPDNGVLVRAVGERVEEVVEIHEVPGRGGPQSATFHGRDLFAPAAAHLCLGRPMGALGPERSGLEPLPVPGLTRDDEGLAGEIIHIDHFGNAVSNIPSGDLPSDRGGLVVEVAGAVISGVARTYSDVEPGTVCALVGSDELLEVAVTEGSAAERLGLTRGDAVRVRGRG